jgi:hypothetical protein
MSNAVNSFLGQNAFSEIENSETIKQIVLSISQKADAENLEQLSEEIFVLAQDIFKALNEIYGRDIHLVKEKLQKHIPRSGAGTLRHDLHVDLFGEMPPPPLKNIMIVSTVFALYIRLASKEDYARRLDNDEYIDSDGDGERYTKAIEELRHLLVTWLGLDPRSFDY